MYINDKPVTVSVHGAGCGGGNNLIRSLRESELNLRIMGTNCILRMVLNSTADKTFHSPASNSESYLSFFQQFITDERIDLLIPNNDSEVLAVSGLREHLGCKLFLPDNMAIKLCQDKNLFYETLKENDIPVVPFCKIEGLDIIEEAFSSLPHSEKYWIRPRSGSGSRGATWVFNSEQARKWISLWSDLRGYSASDYQVALFLPGRDYNVHTIWYEGELVSATMCERLSYVGGLNNLSGMSSSPDFARTCRDDKTMDMILDAIKSLPGIPHGCFNVDLKGNANDKMYITEINIGRFPMIITIHDSTGKINAAETYVRCALGDRPVYKNPFDYDEGYLLIRELDTEPLVVHESKLKEISSTSGPI